jgi:hypothetical protein
MMLRLVLLVPLEPTVDLVRPVVPLVLQEHIKHPQEHPHVQHVVLVLIALPQEHPHVLHVPLDDILHLLDPQVAQLVVVEPITL